MIHPGLALLGLGAALILAATLFWPRRGVVAVLRRGRLSSAELREDALKHLFDAERRVVDCTLESLVGALSATADRVAEALADLVSRGLVVGERGCYRLTEVGRGEAIRVIRIHRLWERYLAEHTGLDELDWHRVADRREHHTSDAEVRALDVQLGHPRWDPHGDPIPTPDGRVPPRPGRPLTGLEEGVAARVVHVEDEPEAVYAALRAAGVQLGEVLRIVRREPRGLRVARDGKRFALTPVEAANVWVTPTEIDDRATSLETTLARLSLGESARVAGLAPDCRGLERRRLLDLGFVPGTDVGVELESAAGDPVAYRVRGALVALRRQQAERVRVVALTAPEGRL